MSTARPPVPARDTGLPPGVQVGPLGRRVVAYVLDSVVPGVATVLVDLGVRDGGNGPNVPLVVIGVVVGLAWAAFCWQQLAVVAATPGMRLLKLQHAEIPSKGKYAEHNVKLCLKGCASSSVK